MHKQNMQSILADILNFLFFFSFLQQFLTMKSLKIESQLIELVCDNLENDCIPNNGRELKKKVSVDNKSKFYDPEIIKIETKNNSLLKSNTQDSEHLLYDTKMNSQKNPTVDDEEKESKATIKLPVINIRGSKRSSIQHKNEEKQQVSDFVKQGKVLGQAITNQSKNRGLGKTNLTDENESDKVSSFLKYIQIKSMKPTEKTPAPKNDLSVRDLKLSKEQKSIHLKLNKNNNERQSSPATNIIKKSAQSKLRIKKSQERSEKVLSNYTIRKERKALSISQNTNHPNRKKFTNTYYDFCTFVCLLNRVQRPITPNATYKAYVAKGNNSILVKNCLKSRFWWNIIDSESEVNLFWSQVKDQKFVDTLKICDIRKQIKQQNEKKMIQFVLPKELKEVSEKEKEKEKQKMEQIRQYTNFGLNRLLSDEQRRHYSKSQYQVEIVNNYQLQDLGNPNKNKMHNHLQYHWHISNKKALYYNLKKYYIAMKEDPFQYIPLTFHIQKFGDDEWLRFIQAYNDREQDMKKKKQNNENKNGKKKKQKNLWIVKPGENSNQGNGIQVFDNCEEIAEMVKSSGERANGKQRSYIIQKYLMPFLYNKRKFDIRCYVLVTSVKGVYKAYWYQEGYIRTSSKEFTLKNLKNRFIHLTNDAVQKKSEDYGKFQNGNKISFSDFQKYLDNMYPEKQYKFFKTVYPGMIKRAADTIKSTCMLMDSKRRQYSFEIFGLDFMIDEDFATWLIEVNTNPCLQLSSPLLARIIPNMVENALKIAIDPLFPPPREVPKTKNLPLDIFESNKFTLIFNSTQDQQVLRNLTKDTNLSNIVESDEQDDNHDDIQ